ncbi:MAG: AEC family transporter [Anaerolineales bacterium]|nr:AEC family transporter [Anaerolineales bacterium]
MIELLLIFVNNLLPILLITAAGFTLGKLTRVEPRTLGRVVFYILSPALIFQLLTTSQLELDRIGLMMGFAAASMLTVGLLTFLVGYLLRLPRPVLIAVVLTAFVTNSGNYGLPLVSFAFGAEALTYASIHYITSAILINSIGIFWVSLGHMDIKQALLGLLKIPTLYALAAALLIMQTGWRLPLPIERSVDLLAGGAIPGMILILGLELSQSVRSQHLLAMGLAIGMRLLGGPLVGSGMAGLFGLEGAARQAGITQVSMPTAVLTTVLASEYDVEPKLVTSVVFFSTILSPFTLTPLIYLLGGR